MGLNRSYYEVIGDRSPTVHFYLTRIISALESYGYDGQWLIHVLDQCGPNDYRKLRDRYNTGREIMQQWVGEVVSSFVSQMRSALSDSEHAILVKRIDDIQSDYIPRSRDERKWVNQYARYLVELAKVRVEGIRNSERAIFRIFPTCDDFYRGQKEIPWQGGPRLFTSKWDFYCPLETNPPPPIDPNNIPPPPPAPVPTTIDVSQRFSDYSEPVQSIPWWLRFTLTKMIAQ